MLCAWIAKTFSPSNKTELKSEITGEEVGGTLTQLVPDKTYHFSGIISCIGLIIKTGKYNDATGALDYESVVAVHVIDTGATNGHHNEAGGLTESGETLLKNIELYMNSKVGLGLEFEITYVYRHKTGIHRSTEKLLTILKERFAKYAKKSEEDVKIIKGHHIFYSPPTYKYTAGAATAEAEAVAAVPTAVVVQNDINVLVICSNPSLKDFPKEIKKPNNILNRLSLSESESEFKFTYTKNFPTDVEHQEHKTFDIIWFAGCNVLKWIFNNNGTISITDRIKLVYNILKDNGKVIFTENTGYIRKYSPENENKISTKIELIKSLYQDNDNFKETHELWYNYFKLIETDEDFYYIKK